MRNAIIAPGRHGAPGGKSVVADVFEGKKTVRGHYYTKIYLYHLVSKGIRSS